MKIKLLILATMLILLCPLYLSCNEDSASDKEKLESKDSTNDSEKFESKELLNKARKKLNSFTDRRDRKSYIYTKIGEQTWMAENLNYKTNEGSWCYDNDEENCKIYGRLYDWATAMAIDKKYIESAYNSLFETEIYSEAESKGICPDGWHLPTFEEWEVLIDYVGRKENVSEKLNAKGTNNHNFSALPAGESLSGAKKNFFGEFTFEGLGYSYKWWSGSEATWNAAESTIIETRGYCEAIGCDREFSDFDIENLRGKQAFCINLDSPYPYITWKFSVFPVRCIKDKNEVTK